MTTAAPDRATHANGFGPSNGQAPPKRRRKGVLPWVAAAVGLLAVAGAVGAYAFLGKGGRAVSNVLTVAVQRGPLVISVNEAGTIKAADQEILKSEIEGRASILFLRPEGDQVSQGELLVELDVSALQDDKVDREIAVQNADAAFVQAKEALAVAKNQAQADVSAAELDYQFAKEDIEKYQKGDFPQELKEAENKITIAREELERAKTTAEGSKRLLDEDFISQSEFDADALSEKKARLDLELAENALQLLKTWDYNRKLNEFESAVEQTELALERAKRKASADVVQAEAELRAKEADFARQKDKLAKVAEQIGKAQIHAPTDGLVVYATTGRGGWRGNDEPLQEGKEVREREELIYLPTAVDRIAEVKIHESSLDKAREGLPARVTVDALPGREFWGTVEKIAPLPDGTISWLNPDLKVYATQVRITGENPALKTGMSCRAEIIVERYDDVVFVPVQSVVRVGGVPSVFVIGADGRPQQREVEIGLDNNQMVVVESGLEEGEEVMLSPPLQDTGSTDAIRAEDVPEERVQQTEAAKENPTAKEAADEQAAAGGGPLTMEQLQRIRGQLMAKTTDEEKRKFGEFFQNGDQAGAMAYAGELAQKYGLLGGPKPDGDSPATRPAEGGEGTEGGEGSAAGDPRAQLMAKLTDAERERLDKLREDGDWQALGPYMRELSEKYGVELPARGGRPGGGGDQGGEGGGGGPGGGGGQ